MGVAARRLVANAEAVAGAGLQLEALHLRLGNAKLNNLVFRCQGADKSGVLLGGGWKLPATHHAVIIKVPALPTGNLYNKAARSHGRVIHAAW